jgi:hypothetical protein
MGLWEMRNPYILSENLKVRDLMEDSGVDGMIILKWFVMK